MGPRVWVGRRILAYRRSHRVQVLTDVRAFGYPHAVTWSRTGERLEVVFRAYKGHVVTTRGWERLPDDPAVYEVSVPFPVGLSGAPLLMEKEGTLIVLGVVLGTDTVTYAGVRQDVGMITSGLDGSGGPVEGMGV